MYKDILIKAREVLVTRGWTQGAYEDSKGCVCLYGALNVADGKEPQDETRNSAAFNEAVAALEDQIGCDYLDVWNDEYDRTVDDVLAVIDRAVSA